MVAAAYRERSPDEIGPVASLDELRATVLSAYVRRMLERLEIEPDAGYGRRDLLSRLGWLAAAMTARAQSVPHIDLLQPDWLPTDLYATAVAHAFVVSRQPAPGEMLVYGSSYGVFGHIGSVVAVEPGRYEVIEQNFIDFSPNLEPHWQTFDLRSIAWPDASVVGLVVAPA